MNKEFDSDLAPILLGAVAGTRGRDVERLTGSVPCGDLCDVGGCDYSRALDGGGDPIEPAPIIEDGGSPPDDGDE